MAEFHNCAIGERRETVFGLGLRAKINRRAGSIAEFQVSRDEVSVEMRQKYMIDLKMVLRREGEVLLDVALRIDDRCSMGFFVADQVGSVSQAIQIKLFEDQGQPFAQVVRF